MMGCKARVFLPVPAVSLEELVPADHFYRHLERALDLAFVRELERAELVRLVLLPEGLRYDLVRKQLVAVRPRASFLAPLRLAWQDWQAQDDGWLVRDAEPAVVTLMRRAGGAHSNA